MQGKTIIFDLDGTLCNIDHRLHHIINPQKKKDYDAFYKACVHDDPIRPVINTLITMRNSFYDIEIWTGRSEQVRKETEDWLVRHSINPLYLTRMRPIGNYIPDDKLKEDWLSKSSFKPYIVFEDRQRVVDMWRKYGITCFQVAQWEEKK